MSFPEAILTKLVLDPERDQIIAHLRVAAVDPVDGEETTIEESVELPNTMVNTNFWYWAKENTLDQLVQRACELLIERHSGRATALTTCLKRLKGEAF